MSNLPHVLKEPVMGAEALPKESASLRFGRFELDRQRGMFQADGNDIALRPKTFALLSYLAANPGRLIPKVELMVAVWPGIVVSDDSLTQCISELRAALGEPGLVRTVARRGYRLEMPVSLEHLPPAPPSPPQRRRRVLVFGAAAAAPLLLVSAWWAWQRRPPFHLDAAFSRQRAVAVLPFVDTGESSSPAFADAVTEDVSIALARIPDLLLFAGASTAKVADETDAARRLGASHALAGSVERRADAVLIRARLLDARNGAQLWSDRFDYVGDAPWTWQRDIAQRIAQSLDVRLREPSRDARADRLDAVAATRRAIHLAIHAGGRADILQARALLEQALAADPDSAIALTFWAFTHTQEVMRRWSRDPKPQIAAASGALDRAFALRPDYWPVHFHRSFVFYLQGRIDEAARACETVLTLWPNEPHALQRLAFYRLQQGRPGEVGALVQLALLLNPLELSQVATGHFYMGMAAFHLRRDDEAYDEMRQAAAANPRLPFPRQWMAAIDALHGRTADARANLADFEANLPGESVARLRASETSRNAVFWDQRERFYAGLLQAGLPHG